MAKPTPVMVMDAAVVRPPVDAATLDAEERGSCVDPGPKTTRPLAGMKGLTVDVEADVEIQDLRHDGHDASMVRLNGGYWMAVDKAPGLTLHAARMRFGDEVKIVRAEETPYGLLVSGMDSNGMKAIVWRKDLGISCAADNGHDDAPKDYGTCYLDEIVAACTSIKAK